MIVGKTVNGYITLQNIDRENAFSESDVRLLTTLANSMSVALENARLFKETEQRNAELAVINSVQEGLVAEMDMQGIYNLVGDKVRDLFDAQVTGIYTFDHEAEMEHFQYLFEDGERLYPESRPLNQIRKWIIKNASILLVNENAKENMFKVTGEQLTAIPGTRLPKSLLFVPLIVGENVRGCVSLQNLDKENAFSESDVRLLGMLANSMSVALENARLFDETTKLLEETKQQAIELKIINSVGDGLAKQMDFQSIIDLVGEKIREVFNAQVVSISTYEKDIEKIHHRYAVELDKRYYFDKPQAIDSDRKEIIETKQKTIIAAMNILIFFLVNIDDFPRIPAVIKIRGKTGRINLIPIYICVKNEK
jgi:GAF domain-containing protein